MADRRSTGHGYLAANQLLTAFSTGSKEEVGKGGVGARKKANPEIQQTTEKDKCRIKNGEGGRAPHFGKSEIYGKARSEARKKERIEAT
jgi:hypothetical protein